MLDRTSQSYLDMYTRNPGVYPVFQPCSPFKTAYQVSRQPTCLSSQFVARTTRSGKLWTHPLGLQFVTRTSEAGQGTTITTTCNGSKFNSYVFYQIQPIVESISPQMCM